MTKRQTDDLTAAVLDWFTAPVDLPGCPDDAAIGSIWWERRGDTEYPWRIVDVKSGYPCGEPRKIRS